ncbi:MAG: hypothetical protein MUC29_10735 [Pyrinomonadaceae bacterium]|nr:hypothetical protein [Pyrinomonadaceae bacterium]
MADFKDRFSEWQKQAKEKFEEIDKQFGIKDKLEEGVKVASDIAQEGVKVATDVAGKGVEAVKDVGEKIKSEAEKTDVGKQAVKVAEDTFKTAEKTAKTVYEASEPIRDAAEDATKNAGEVAKDVGEKASEVVKDASEVVKEAGKKAGEVLHVAAEKASEVFDEANQTFKKTTKTASDIFGFGSSVGKTLDSAYKTLSKTADWVTENPLQALGTGVSMAVGAGLGVGFSLVSSNWLFHSALPAWSVKRISDEFLGYLKAQENLIELGELSQADLEKAKFEREIVKYVGSPLLGAFSCAAGVMMFAQIFNPKTITGFPISWLLGGNPILEGVWLFGNGLVCIKVGVEFFMISLEDQEDVQKIVKEIKGLLPQTV